MVSAWHYNPESSLDPTDTHQFIPNQPVSLDVVAGYGVQLWTLSLPDYAAHLEQIQKQHGYTAQEVSSLSKQAMDPEKYQKKLTSSFEPHFHQDEEVKLVLEGGGYFDIQREDQTDASKWIRIHVQPGDLISVPAGLYHRFTLDSQHHIKQVRLYFKEREWVRFTKEQAEAALNSYRVAYLSTLKA